VGLPKDKKELALDEERGRAQSPHPLVGEMLLKSHPGFELIADIVRHLHENVDGSGTPDGLYGDSIPVGSRIVSVASFYDHEITANPRLGVKGALAKMEEKRSVIFDDTVLNLLEEYLNTAAGESEKTVDCTVFTLVEGMELASDVNTASGINLLRKGTILNREILGKIMKFNNVDPITGPIKVKQS
jgi:HD-GYP domain-containing protein (c-di-GMP phosphodiesterase class II)